MAISFLRNGITRIIFFAGFIIGILLAFPFGAARAQAPFGGFIGAIYPGACTASNPSAIPFIVAGLSTGPLMYVPGAGITYPAGPPVHTGQPVLGFSAGFIPCLMWVPCGPAVCPAPFPPQPGGQLVVMIGTGP